jgi:hypothetical protein
MARKRRVFLERTPLGYRVLLTRDRWREIVRFKHPAMAGHEAVVRECVRDPDVIRASAKDPDVHLFYRSSAEGTVCTVVGGDPNARFVVTAYFTRNPKKGPDLWTR